MLPPAPGRERARPVPRAPTRRRARAVIAACDDGEKVEAPGRAQYVPDALAQRGRSGSVRHLQPAPVEVEVLVKCHLAGQEVVQSPAARVGRSVAGGQADRERGRVVALDEQRAKRLAGGRLRQSSQRGARRRCDVRVAVFAGATPATGTTSGPSAATPPPCPVASAESTRAVDGLRARPSPRASISRRRSALRVLAHTPTTSSTRRGGSAPSRACRAIARTS